MRRSYLIQDQSGIETPVSNKHTNTPPTRKNKDADTHTYTYTPMQSPDSRHTHTNNKKNKNTLRQREKFLFLTQIKGKKYNSNKTRLAKKLGQRGGVQF